MQKDKEAHILIPNIERAETVHSARIRAVKTGVFKWQAVTGACCLLARTTLLYYYAKCITETQLYESSGIFGRESVTAWTFFFMEIAFALYRIYPQHLQALHLGPKARFRDRLRLVGNDVPRVDILIFYCGEELNVLLDTVRAACSQDYPSDKFRVVVLDDSSSVSSDITDLKQQFSNLYYSARKNKKSGWHKAGNINHGLDHITKLPGGPSEFVAGLDVDMIAESDWLRRCLPHLIQDSNLGLVCPYQRFYNILPGDPLGQILQFDQLQQVRNIRKEFGGIGLGGGTGWIARRKAIDMIDGFAVDGTSEDFLTCVDLMERDWGVALLDEDAQYGLAPDSFNGHQKQYQRWTGTMLSFYKALDGSSPRRKQLALKFFAEFSTVWYMVGMSICYFGLPILALSNQPFIRYMNYSQFAWLIRLGFLDFVAQSLHGFLESWVADFNIYCWHEPSHLWHTPLYIEPLLRRWLPNITDFVFGRLGALQPGISPANRSSEDQCASRWQRLKVIVKEGRGGIHICVLGAFLAGFGNLLFQLKYTHRDPLEHFIAHVGWPPVLFFWTSVLRNALVPFYYALCVPPRAEREKYLVRDEKSGIAHPTMEAKDREHRRVSEWQLLLILGYFACLAIASVAL